MNPSWNNYKITFKNACLILYDSDLKNECFTQINHSLSFPPAHPQEEKKIKCQNLKAFLPLSI